MVLGKEARRHFLVPGGAVIEEHAATKCVDAGFSPKTPEFYWYVEAPGDAAEIERELASQLNRSGWISQSWYANHLGYRVLAWIHHFEGWSGRALVGIANFEYFVRISADLIPNCPELGESPADTDRHPAEFTTGAV